MSNATSLEAIKTELVPQIPDPQPVQQPVRFSGRVSEPVPEPSMRMPECTDLVPLDLDSGETRQDDEAPVGRCAIRAHTASYLLMSIDVGL